MNEPTPAMIDAVARELGRKAEYRIVTPEATRIAAEDLLWAAFGYPDGNRPMTVAEAAAQVTHWLAFSAAQYGGEPLDRTSVSYQNAPLTRTALATLAAAVSTEGADR